MDWCARLWRCSTGGVPQKRSNSRAGRVVALSAISGFMAPLVFVSVIVFRKAERRGRAKFRFWNRRLQHEIARWS
jgi:hypothetical protein